MATVKRSYRSPRRREQAEATRRLILQAALELFIERGFAETSIRGVAERAGVSDQTIYKAFGDKVGLLYHAALRYIETGGGGAEAELLAALAAEPDPIERIRMAARSSRELWETGALELDLLVSRGEVRDPRLDELQRRSLAYELETNRAICAVLFPDGLRRPGSSVDDIAAFITAIDSGPVMSRLRSLGWSLGRWEAWAVELLTLFLDPLIVEARDEKR
jgi:AcrR family transcriptional regulator